MTAFAIDTPTRPAALWKRRPPARLRRAGEGSLLGQRAVPISEEISVAHESARSAATRQTTVEGSLDEILPLVYDELRRVAHRALARERDDHTLTTTALVHEAYLKLAGQQHVPWDDRAHFLAVAATAMRRVLVDYARWQKRLKRGGGARPVPLFDASAVADERADVLLALDDALSRLGAVDARLARVVEYRFFGGMSSEEVGAVLGVTRRTVERDWQKARAWLGDQLAGRNGG